MGSTIGLRARQLEHVVLPGPSRQPFQGNISLLPGDVQHISKFGQALSKLLIS